MGKTKNTFSHFLYLKEIIHLTCFFIEIRTIKRVKKFYSIFNK